jgi:hypothetical protein
MASCHESRAPVPPLLSKLRGGIEAGSQVSFKLAISQFGRGVERVLVRAGVLNVSPCEHSTWRNLQLTTYTAITAATDPRLHSPSTVIAAPPHPFSFPSSTPHTKTTLGNLPSPSLPQHLPKRHLIDCRLDLTTSNLNLPTAP